MMNDTRATHWNRVYDARKDSALTWFEAEPAISLRLIAAVAKPSDGIVDIGGGASRLPDALLAEGFADVTVLDLSASALAISRARLGPAADEVTWIAADVTAWRPERRFLVWHDRAVFHFLTAEEDQRAYAARMAEALCPGGHAIIATFAEDGPDSCSGLPVVRYAPEDLADRLATLAPGRFAPVGSERHVHRTPKGNEQRFQISVFRRR